MKLKQKIKLNFILLKRKMWQIELARKAHIRPSRLRLIMDEKAHASRAEAISITNVLCLNFEDTWQLVEDSSSFN